MPAATGGKSGVGSRGGVGLVGGAELDVEEGGMLITGM